MKGQVASGVTMTSIITNRSATAALATLRAISSDARDTAAQVSSGMRVATARDNAAYWSVSTTMDGDRRSVSAVADALGLGAAKVDTVYTGLESTVDILSAIKERVVAAAEEGVDRSKVQEEIEQLKQQVLAVSEAASFAGINWLSTDIADIYSAPSARVVSSYARREDGSVRVESVDVPLHGLSLFNTTGGGLLQADDRGVGDIGGLRNFSASSTGQRRSLGFDWQGPLYFADDTTQITFDITLDADNPANTTSPQPGVTRTITINRSLIDQVMPTANGLVDYIGEWSDVLEYAVGETDLYVPYNHVDLNYSVMTRENLARGAGNGISNVVSTLPGGLTGGLVDTPMEYGSRPTAIMREFTQGFTLHPSNMISIPLSVNGQDTGISITREAIDATLGKTTGEIANRTEMVAVLNALLAPAGVYAIEDADGIRFHVDPDFHPESGRKATLVIGRATDLVGADVVSADLLSLDITSGGAAVDAALADVEAMLGRVTAAASAMGSLSKRIALQTEFAKVLMDSMASGIGRLVDADMNEASTRIKALQARERLAVSALQIANSQPAAILDLYR